MAASFYVSDNLKKSHHISLNAWFYVITPLQEFTVSSTEFVTWKKNMHSREITAMMFFNPLKFLITGAYDGSSK